MFYLKEIRTENTVFALREDGFLESNLLDGHTGKLELEEAFEMVSAMEELCTDGAKPILSILGECLITDGARMHVLDNLHVSSAALVANTFLANMMANLLMNFKKLPIPVRMFRDKEKALNWLREIERTRVLETRA